jgi:hypothetical protein
MAHSRSAAWRLAKASAVCLMMAGAVTGIAPAAASAATCQSWSGAQPPSPGADNNQLNAIAVLSACDAWTVGSFDSGSGSQTLIEHWNGHTWKQASSPNLGGSTGRDTLGGVTATSASNAWAVGGYDNGSTAETVLILHWNGSTWKPVTGPRLGTDNELFAVAASSRSSVWAVGDFSDGGNSRALAVHCC